MPLIVYIFLTLYTLANVYLYCRIRSALPARRSIRRMVMVVVAVLYSSYWVAGLGKHLLPYGIIAALRWTGSWWIGFLFYMTIILLLIDLLRVAGRLSHLLPSSFWRPPPPARRAGLLVVIGVVLTLLLTGYLNARNPRVNTLHLRLRPSCGQTTRLNLVFLSDLHLGVMVNGSFLKRAIEQVNSLEPDLVLLVGDTVDMDVREIDRMGCGKIISRIRANLGVYAVTGNHEYITGVEEAVEYLSRCGITFLRDRAIKIDDSFYLAGREDLTRWRKRGERKSLRNVLGGLDPGCPVILLDHQPARIGEAVEEGVDLLLSGHTHNGQLFPLNLIIGALYQVSWGYSRQGETQVYVTSGAGTWAPPVRIGNIPEIVQIKIEFGPGTVTVH